MDALRRERQFLNDSPKTANLAQTGMSKAIIDDSVMNV
jgi:hypothetical protein